MCGLRGWTFPGRRRTDIVCGLWCWVCHRYTVTDRCYWLHGMWRRSVQCHIDGGMRSMPCRLHHRYAGAACGDLLHRVCGWPIQLKLGHCLHRMPSWICDGQSTRWWCHVLHCLCSRSDQHGSDRRMRSVWQWTVSEQHGTDGMLIVHIWA